MNIEIFEELLEQFKGNRDKLITMINDLEKIQEKIERLIPESLDKRYKFFFEERVKTIIGVFTALLDIRKEISRSLKDEIDLRRKLTLGDEESVEESIDIIGLAKRVERLQKKTAESEKKGNKLEELVLSESPEEEEPFEQEQVKLAIDILR